MNIVWMAHTLEWIINSNQTKEAIEWGTDLMKIGEVKTTPSGLRYILIEQN